MKKLACFALVNLTMSLPTLASEFIKIPSVAEIIEFAESAKTAEAPKVEAPKVEVIAKTTEITVNGAVAATGIEAVARTAEGNTIETVANIAEPVANTAEGNTIETVANIAEPVANTAEGNTIETVANIAEPVANTAEGTTVEAVANRVEGTAIEPAMNIAEAAAIEPVANAAEGNVIEPAMNIAEAAAIEPVANVAEGTAIEPIANTTEATEVAKATGVLVDEKNNVSKTLDTFHVAASKADWVSYFDQMSDNSVFIGTDAAERWEKAAFQVYASKRKEGWIYTVRQRHINFTPDGKSAWFDEILDSKNYGTSRGTGVLVSTDKGWKIVQYHLTFPIPNSLAKKITTDIKNFEQSTNTLNTFHQAASEADWTAYFNQMSNDAVFLGTDAAERWEKEAFRAYANARNEGWSYTTRKRNISFTADGLTAWFDEILDSKIYGTSRGSGLMINTKEGWKISQYSLTFPIPNDLAAKVTTDIKKFEYSQKQAKN